MVDLSNVSLSDLAAATGNLDFGGYKGVNVADPGADQDAATKKYHDDNKTSDAAEIVSGVFDDARISASIARDAEVTGAISTHAGLPSVHHTKYTDAEAVSAVSGETERAYGWRNGNQSVNSGAWTDVALNTEKYDTGVIFSTATGKFTIPDTGYYLVIYYVKWDTGSVFPKRFGAAVYLGATPLFDVMAPQTGANSMSVGAANVSYFNAGNVINMKAYQDSGAAMNIYGGNAASTYMIVNRVL